MHESNLSKINSFEKELYNNHIPILNNTLILAEKKLSKEQFHYDNLKSLFILDPMCLFNFLTCANQYAKNSSSKFKETIKTPKHASMLLGIDNIGKCIDKLTTLNMLENPAIAYKIEQIALRSLHCAYQARNMARLIHCKKEDEVFLSALMMSLAEIFIWFVSPQKAQQYELLIYTQSVEEVEAQHKIFGFSFVDLIVHMKSQWRLPKLYIKALKTESLDNAKKAIICIKLADKLSRLVDFGWYYQDIYEHLDYCALKMHFNTQRLAKEFHHVVAEMSNDIVGFYKLALPINALILQPGKIPYFPVLKLKTKSRNTNIQSQKKTRNVEQQKYQVKPDNQLDNTSNLPELINLTINKLFQSEYFDQVILLMLNKSKKSMTIYIEKTKLTESQIQKKITIFPNKNLFSLLLKKPYSIYINLSNFEQYKELITDQISNVLPAREFFAKAFYYKNKPIGIFYVANKEALDKAKYSTFNKTLVTFENQVSRLT